MALTLQVDVVAGGARDAAYAVLDVRAPAGAVLPPHVPAHQDGAVLVLEGRVEVALAELRRAIGPGGALALPRGVPRRLTVLEDARLIALTAPAGPERLAALLHPPAPDHDDVAAHLAAVGVALLPAGWGA